MQAISAEYMQSTIKLVKEYQLLESNLDQEFQKLTSLAQQIFEVPVTLLVFPNEHRLVFKSQLGLNNDHLELEPISCADVFLLPDIKCIDDVQQSSVLSKHPFISGIPNTRFYAASPIIEKNGQVLGALILIDYQPRSLTANDQSMLRQLTDIMMDRVYEKKSAEQQIKFLEIFIDAIPDALVACDNEGRLTQFNKIARDWHGVDVMDCAPELLSFYYDLYEEDGITVLPFERIPLIRAFHGEIIQKAIICIKARGKEPRWVSCNGERFCSEAGLVLGALIIMHDITEDIRLKQLKNEFISTVSHELRTPITSILGSLDLVINKVAGELPEKATKMLQIAHVNSKRLQVLVNDLLDMEKLAAGKYDFNVQCCDLQQECQKALTTIQPFADKFQVELCLLTQTECQLMFDRDRLQQVLSNLLSNAIKHSSAGGKVFVSYTNQNGFITVQIEDKGQGIPLEFQQHIFQRFFQADCSNTRKASGTGLGLAICKAIIESAGGKIGFQSVAGEGTRFFFTCPSAI